jgi:hypothetical protein
VALVIVTALCRHDGLLVDTAAYRPGRSSVTPPARLHEDLETLPFDIVVATPGDLDKYGASPGLIYHHILRDGRELYAA